ncbi:coiled-coil domain-containing protein 47 [Nannochloropsis gaditana]|uniref:Coiled-coil domain-containing protein 47 n=1 Tax=Nannochloropsis gaditana TaxID=72520 RepID=W7TLQ4_9STRA|nr:coiled-coil domain-containing protein 47 [Nannochloropsis gaditana]
MPTAASPPPLRALLLLFWGAIGIQCMTAAAHGITDDEVEDEFLTPDPPPRPFATFSWLGLPSRVSRISMYEICMLQILLCFLLRFRWGRRENERIKALFLEQCASLLSEQFAYVGPGSEVGREGSQPAEGRPGKEEDLVAFKEANACFQFWASGRRHLPRGMAITVDLQPRQDLLHVLRARVLPGEDSVTLEAGLSPEDVPPIILALSRRLHHRSLHLLTPDLLHHTSLLLLPVLLPDLDTAHFVVYADNAAPVPLALPPRLARRLNEHKHFFDHIHISDQNSTPVG